MLVICNSATFFAEIYVYVQIYYLAYDKAKKILQNNYRVLEKIVEELLEFEILTGKVKNSLYSIIF